MLMQGLILMKGKGSTGAFMRDDRQSFIATSNNFVDYACDVLAVRYGLYLANQVGCNSLVIQSNWLEIIISLNEAGFTATTTAPILEDKCIHVTSFTKVEYVLCS
jgi:hypothetical protein